MTLIKFQNEKIYRCPIHKNQKRSIRNDSFLENHNISLSAFVQIVYSWACKTPINVAVEQCGISEKSMIQWYQYLRDAVSHKLVEHEYQIGGVGHIVEIDESLIAKRKNHVGRVIPERWVFGGYDRSTKKGFLVLVEDRTAHTLLGAIVRYIKPGTMIYSDCWASYNGISDIQVTPRYTHQRVNHSENFVDPITGTHTNNIECYWKNAKRRFKSMLGVQSTTLTSHLDEFMWREEYGKTCQDALNNILKHISEWYIVN